MPAALAQEKKNVAPSTHLKSSRLGKSKGLVQAYELRDVTWAAAKAYAESLKTEDGKMILDRDAANGIAALVRAWESCDERVRIHRGKPLPGSLRPTAKASKGRRSSPPAPQEPPLIAAAPLQVVPAPEPVEVPSPATIDQLLPQPVAS